MQKALIGATIALFLLAVSGLVSIGLGYHFAWAESRFDGWHTIVVGHAPVVIGFTAIGAWFGWTW